MTDIMNRAQIDSAGTYSSASGSTGVTAHATPVKNDENYYLWSLFNNPVPQPSPEWELWAAVLETAIHDIRTAKTAKKLQKYLSWFFCDDSDGVGTFLFVCDTLGLAPSMVRREILKEQLVTVVEGVNNDDKTAMVADAASVGSGGGSTRSYQGSPVRTRRYVSRIPGIS